MGIELSGRLILASASPRRHELLKGLGLSFEVFPSDVDEIFQAGETPRGHVLRLCQEKTKTAALLHPDAFVLGADTIVVIDGEVLGKPASPAEAERMLERLSGRLHKVFTGFCLANRERKVEISRVVESEVLFREITADELAWYTQSDEPYDKAGAYAVQGMGALFIKEIRGSYTNVMGLPLCEVVDVLKGAKAVRFCGDGHGRGR